MRVSANEYDLRISTQSLARPAGGCADRAKLLETVEKVAELLSGDVSLVYAGYPFDPFAPDKSIN